ncbi:hypothetical protein BKK50_05710 [Rodentibacter rarus]|uniref:Uncharacterized protein n=1 Tax=Rodentibacter rarus TaxID=1908260 RepID=A0A1V3IMD3_9PAST|nr:hypothetical protein BKK50_05710 [Rodentibacter rarus]
MQDDLVEEQNKNRKKQYFVRSKSNIKNKFYIDEYSQARINLIACAENAKPIGDGNWIKTN